MNWTDFKDSLNVNTLKRRKLEIGDVIYLRFTRDFIEVDKYTLDSHPIPGRDDTSMLWADDNDDDDPGEILLNAKQRRTYKKLMDNGRN